jgi:hypothetical protein
VLAAAREGDYFDQETIREVESFLNNPEGWAEQNLKTADV